ncbi:hypothetical protein FACS1894109_04000 [Spirochaetia bacterium]|nr:hypothetical protein FACS1894109_04000 [Spirochaetia bacterium]
MIKRNEVFENINAIMLRFGGEVYKIRPKNRGYTAGGNLVHVLIIGNQTMATKGVTNSHGPKSFWDEMYMESTNGGLELDPKEQALFVKDESKDPKEKGYTFRGIYKIDVARSTEFKTVSCRSATEVDETDPNWKIVRQN